MGIRPPVITSWTGATPHNSEKEGEHLSFTHFREQPKVKMYPSFTKNPGVLPEEGAVVVPTGVVGEELQVIPGPATKMAAGVSSTISHSITKHKGIEKV